MKKIYKVILLLFLLFFLSTYNPIKSRFLTNQKDSFFKIENIEITNTFLISKNQINDRLEDIYNKNIFLIKKSDIKEPLKDINFLDKIEVKKKYPNTIIIKIYETKPVAIIFKNKVKYFLDNLSALVDFNEKIDSSSLPNIFGEGAEINFLVFFKKLESKNFPTKKIENYYFFPVGRWDIEFIDGKIIKFPDKNVDEAIKKSLELFNRKDFQNYNIIDLRVIGTIIVE